MDDAKEANERLLEELRGLREALEGLVRAKEG